MEQALIYACRDGDAKAVERVLQQAQGSLDVNGEISLDLPSGEQSNPATLLAISAGRGQLDVVLALLSGRADPNLKDSQGYTAFHLACAHGRTECAEALARSRCDIWAVNKQGQCGFDLACAKGHTTVVDRFVEIETEEQLFAAVNGGDREKLQALLDDGAPVETMMVTQMCQRVAKVTALYLAVRANQKHVAEMLLDARADPNHVTSEGHTPLMGAAVLGDSRLAFVHLLHNHDADLDATVQADGYTAFHLACLNGQRSAAVAETLVALGCGVCCNAHPELRPQLHARCLCSRHQLSSHHLLHHCRH